MGLVRDFMRMDIDPPPVEKPKKFRYIGELRYDITNKVYRDVWVKAFKDGRWCHWQAFENEVFRYNDNLYVWTGKEWTDFHPGPCTDYDGPRPNDKKIYLTSQGILDSNDPFHRMIQEKTDILMKQLGFGYKNDTATDIAKMAEEAMRWYEKPPVLNWGVPNAIEQNGDGILAKYDLKYIGETDTNVRDNPKGWLVQIIHHTGTTICMRTIAPEIGFVVSYNDVEYVYTGPEKGWVAINNYRKEETIMPVHYNRIYPRLAIKKVIFNAPATIVFWDDGTKTVVKCENEEYDPEKGLAMAIAKKALGNQGNYYNQFKKWMLEKEEVSIDTESEGKKAIHDE